MVFYSAVLDPMFGDLLLVLVLPAVIPFILRACGLFCSF